MLNVQGQEINSLMSVLVSQKTHSSGKYEGYFEFK